MKKKTKKAKIDGEGGKNWRCVICSTEEDLKLFKDANDLVFHHMSHPILELAQALADVQKLLKSIKFFDEAKLLCAPKNRVVIEEDKSNDNVDENEDTIVEHKASDTGAKKHKCHVCNKILSSRGNLNKHMIIHDPEKKFECPICHIKFNQSRDLKNHEMTIHTGERPYICKTCGKGFVHKHYLAEHMDYHSGDRKYQCPQCGKRFQSSSTLSKHMERHKGLRSHQCKFCSKSFLVHVDLRSHVRSVHEKTGNTGIPLFNPDSQINEEIPPNYAPIEQPQPKPSHAIEGYPTYAQPVPVLRMAWPLNDLDDEKRRKEIESQQIDEWMIAQGASIPNSTIKTDEVESLTLTNMENHSHTMLVLPASSINPQ